MLSDQEKVTGIAIILLIVAAFVVMVNLGGAGVVRAQAIERGYALYCPDTGRFAWKDECKSKQTQGDQ